MMRYISRPSDEDLKIFKKIAQSKARGDDTIEVKLIKGEDNIICMFMDISHQEKKFRQYFCLPLTEAHLNECIEYAYEQIEARKKTEGKETE